MADKPTESCNYKSRFGGGWVRPDQYLAENMTDRIARHQGNPLPFRFWQDKVWEKVFLNQRRYAAALIKKYSIEAICQALKTPQGKKVYSFGATFLEPMIIAEQKKIDAIPQREETEIKLPPPVVLEKPRPSFGGDTQMAKLRRLG